MVREPDATRQPTPHDIQLMSKHRVLSLKPQLRLERRGQDGQNETEQPDHSASLGDSITSSTRIRFSVTQATNDEADSVDLFVRKTHHRMKNMLTLLGAWTITSDNQQNRNNKCRGGGTRIADSISDSP